jgi:molybdate transport system permease protein
VIDLSYIAFPLRLSFQVAILSTFAVAITATPVAYALATRSVRGGRLLDAMLTLPMVLPPVVTGYYLLLIIGRNGLLGRLSEAVTGTAVGLNFTWQAAVIAAAVVSFPLALKTARTAIESVDPALVRMSHTLGRSEAETIVHVVMPLAWRGIAAGLALAFARALGEFGATVIVAGNMPGSTNTMALEIYNAVMYGDWGVATGLVLLFTTLSLVVLVGADRLVRGAAQ